jgi:hypothetical protein
MAAVASRSRITALAIAAAVIVMWFVPPPEA